MTEEEPRNQGEPEKAAGGAAARASSGADEKAVGLGQRRSENTFFTFALTSLMLGLELLTGWAGKSGEKKPGTGAALPAGHVEEPAQTADLPIEIEGGTLEVETDAEVARRRKWGTPLVLCAFAVGIAGGVGFMFLYWSGGGNRLLGGSLALCLGGFGAVLVLYAQFMLRQQLVIAPREEIPSDPSERESAFVTFSSGARDVQRRSLLKWMAGLAAGLFAAIAFSLFRSLAITHPAEALFTTVWKPGERLMTADGKALTADSLQPGSSMTVFPESSIGSEQSQTVLVRVDQRLLQLPKGRANWAPMGYVAYSRICTHAGCAVGMFETRPHLLLCPCHQSTFDVLRGAVPTSGPAARPLPQLPLYLDKNGYLRAQGGFTTPPGPGFTGMPS